MDHNESEDPVTGINEISAASSLFIYVFGNISYPQKNGKGHREKIKACIRVFKQDDPCINQETP
jgi:hypothetical protein